MKLSNSIERKKCVGCGHNHLSPLSCLPNFPIFMGATTQDPKEDLFEDLDVGYCEKCFLAQLRILIDPKILYANSHNPGIGKTWQKHNKFFVEYIANNIHIDNTIVVDFGGANGKIAQLILSKYKPQEYIIVDFNHDKYPKIDGARYYKELPEYYKGKVNILILSHVYEHFYEPREMIKYLESYLVGENSYKYPGKIFVSCPNISVQIRDNHTNSLNFEHTFNINEIHFDDINKYYRYSNYCLFTHTIDDIYQNKDDNILNNINDVYNIKYKQLFEKHYLPEIESNKPFFLFGGHVFSQWVYYNLSPEQKTFLLGVLDNDPDKQYKRLYGTPLKIYDPNNVDKSIRVYVKCAQYSQEIRDGLLRKGFEEVIII